MQCVFDSSILSTVYHEQDLVQSTATSQLYITNRNYHLRLERWSSFKVMHVDVEW